MAKCGTPCRKLVVPSSGSTIQRLRPSPLVSPPSSPRKPYSGRVRRKFGAQRALGLDVGVADEIARALLGDLQLLDLAEVALQVLGGGEGGADHHRDGGRAHRQRTALGRARALAARRHRARGRRGRPGDQLVRSPGRRSVGTATVRSILGAFHVAAVLGVDHQARCRRRYAAAPSRGCRLRRWRACRTRRRSGPSPRHRPR